MFHFLSKEFEGDACELRIDQNIFSPQIVMKAAYSFLDRAYFLFFTQDDALILRVTPKSKEEWDAEKFILEYSDELLNFQLRVQLEYDNKRIRESIIGAAIANSLDASNFAVLDTDKKSLDFPQNQTNLSQDIDDILRELESDSDIKISEIEINKILKEIEDETELRPKYQNPMLNTQKVKEVKAAFERNKDQK